MKTVFKFALMGFAASLLVMGCSKSDTTPEDNPNYDSEKNVVNTSFVFNVSTGNTPVTKMNAANTQATSATDFRGISDAYLFAYKLGTTNDGKWVATATTADKTYGLGAVLAPNAIETDGSKSHRILEISLPVETNALMFWGKAPQSGTDANNAQGKITYSAANADISQHNFGLVSRVASGSAGADALAHWQEMLSALINAVVNTKYNAAVGTCTWDPDGTASSGDEVSNTSAIELYWSDFVDVDGTTGALSVKTTDPQDPTKPMNSLGEILGDAFKVYNTVYADEVRAGSGSAVHYMMKDLYGIVHKLADASQTTPSTYEEYVATQVAHAIEVNILKVIDVNGDPRATSDLKTNSGVSYTDISGNLDDFPQAIAVIGLPKGATQLKVTIDKTAGAHPVATWAYEANIKTGVSGTTSTIYNYMYPAELCYFGNSPIRVTDQEVKANEYPEGVTNWDTDSEWASKAWQKGKHVLSTTRSVAMLYNINYGTALLKTTVGFKSGVTQLEDNNAAIQLARTGATEENKKIDVASNLFELTGILVGGQVQNVGWNYLPKSGESFSYTIYDKAIVDPTVPTTANKETYTLVWDNYNASNGGDNNAQMEVLVALEFTNKAGDFWGKDNLIRNNGTFYLVGKLDPKATGLATLTWPTKYALPPYTDGTTINPVTRVFIQDYMTTASFVFDATSLQKAYVTVPDLRSTQISLGLSVDLKWSTGLVFDNIPLGN